MPRSVEIDVWVRYPEVDRMAVAHHAAYLNWLEIGRTEWLRASGHSYGELEAGGVLLPVIELGVKYRSPARYDELLRIVSTDSEWTGVRCRFDYRIERQGELLADGFSVHAVVGHDGRPKRFPRELQESMSAWMEGR